MRRQLEGLFWPRQRAGEALVALAPSGGGARAGGDEPTPPPPPAEGPAGGLATYLESVADHRGLETEPWTLAYDDGPAAVARRAPCLLAPRGGEEEGLLAVRQVRGARAWLVAPGGGTAEVAADALLRALRWRLDREPMARVERTLEASEVDPARRPAARERLLAARLGGRPVARGWQLRMPPGASFLAQARDAGLAGLLGRFLAAYAVKMVLWLSGWWVLWQAVRHGAPGAAWMAALVLAIFTVIPFRLLEPWYGGLFGVRLGWLLKRRLLAGALRLDPDEIRHRGSGRLLGTALESEAAETLALDGGILVLSHAVDLALAAPLLWWGAGGALHLWALLLWVAATALLAALYYRARRQWTCGRIALTDDLVEKMAGHRTRLVQQAAARRHEGEDSRLASYLALARRPDRLAALLAALPGYGWLLASLAALAPALVGRGAADARVALGVGGMLLAFKAFSMMGPALVSLGDAAIAAGQVSFLWRAASRPREPGDPAVAIGAPSAERPPGEVVLEGRELEFSYRPGHRVLRGCSLDLRQGDRILVHGPSGGGKSTLTSILTGLRAAGRGTLLLDGLDRQSLGEAAWRRRFSSAPQFHENHVFVGTFAFNLLLGRGWPPAAQDLARAEEICRELGLGPLLERMPAGLQQTVGEVGWQLSHGEQSRLFVARALLQEAPVVVLDESFGSLDPASLRCAMECVERHAPTLVVIAHP
ncbi:MAG TPA: ATP-binding cassette domain-containing protein [Thermoanaerobaculia bacterium]|nr:ATP-binding cassette domain-containing protein [Thermoanaerobaculia bacterium]